MMDRDTLKAYGAEMLDMIRQSCVSDERTFASRTGVFDAEEVFAALAAYLERKTYPTPNYDDFDLLAACIFVLAADPDAYLRMVGDLGWKTEEMDVTSVRGAQRLEGLLSALGDDHDYLVRIDADGGPALVNGHLGHRPDATYRYISPRTLLAALRPVVEDMVESPIVGSRPA